MEFATPPRPGSAGEHAIQDRYGTRERADRFYQRQMLDHLNDRMQVFVGRQEMIFVSTADAHGECDSSFRAGPPGFVRVLDERTITWPEYRGNGVMASMGNITENPHVGVLMMDFFKDVIGLHVNGRAAVVPDTDMQARYPWLMEEAPDGRRPERWVMCFVEEAYVHCSKHIPRMMRVRSRRSANETRKPGRKGADYFDAGSSPCPWRPPEEAPEPAAPEPALPEPAPAEPVPTAGPTLSSFAWTPIADELDAVAAPPEPRDYRERFAQVREELGQL